jgi:hypothetical protein
VGGEVEARYGRRGGLDGWMGGFGRIEMENFVPNRSGDQVFGDDYEAWSRVVVGVCEL